MENEIRSYLDAIGTNYVTKWNFEGSTSSQIEVRDEMNKTFLSKLRAEEGKVYIKVITNGSAHSFIVMSDGPKFKKGDILKAASWSAPAKNFARGNILDRDSYKGLSWTGM